jgi:prophage maintenance system killer protein
VSVSVVRLELADFLLIAEAVLEIPANRVARDADLTLADSALHAPLARFAGADFYQDFATKAAVLCAHLIKNHPLKDGNTPVALIATIEFCERNGFSWSPAPDDIDGSATADLLLSVAAEPLSELTIARLSEWIAIRIARSTPFTG